MTQVSNSTPPARLKRLGALALAYGQQVFIAADQLVNALIPPLDGTVSYADETLSARAYRAHRDGKVLGKLFMPIINLLFFWQGPGHCKNAYTKEFDRKNYPSEYQPPNQPRYTSRSTRTPS
ncbi:hypothetical protein IB236_13230 [Acidovorax sp. ACV02]|uniref:hypothetical protein n=1 Tax=Acidovorax sp. ACV02 TaxID=2769310 RepID=UPI001786874A|nr:hypothetical protein [Acidovorax sp. ACV02]MBD9406305.1 hypothetical protein [Acidovorax sp. ACV02]